MIKYNYKVNSNSTETVNNAQKQHNKQKAMVCKCKKERSAMERVKKKSHGGFKQKWKYIKQNWQLYVIFLMPAFVLTFIFKYIPMGGILIAFKDYNAFQGIWGS